MISRARRTTPRTVRRLEDIDGDGRFDKATVFAKGLRWPSAIHCYGGGVLVGRLPDLFYYKDTNDDGVADEKEVVLTGWGNRAGTLIPKASSAAWPGVSTTGFTAWSTATPGSSPIPGIPPQNRHARRQFRFRSADHDVDVPRRAKGSTAWASTTTDDSSFAGNIDTS